MLNTATVYNPGVCGAPENPAIGEILGATLEDSRNYLADLRSFMISTADQFRTGEILTANGSLGELISGLGLLLRAIDTVSAGMGIDFAQTFHEGKSLEKIVNELNGVLMEVLSTQERKDWVLLADLLEYELMPYLDLWNRIFGSMQTAIR